MQVREVRGNHIGEEVQPMTNGWIPSEGGSVETGVLAAVVKINVAKLNYYGLYPVAA